MERCRFGLWIPVFLLGLPSGANGQTPFNANAEAASDAPKIEVGGSATIDIITLKGVSPGVPLRFGNVLAGSERVEFNGKPLVKGSDYQIDYAAGVVYLMRAQKAGQTLTVSYRYKKDQQSTSVSSSGFAGLPTFKYALVPNGLNAVFGLGLTERSADGNVVSSNLYGLNNTFGFGSSNLTGVMLLADRQKTETRSGYEYRDKPGEANEGQSRLILQNLSTKVGGGSITADYQDISSNFSSFGALQGNGYAPEKIDQLAKEKGLKRMSFGMNDVSLGGLKLNNNYRTVNDGGKIIEWKNFALNQGGLNFKYSSQKVDQDFTRFQDIAEADREQLMREAGLNRESLGFDYKSGLAALAFNSKSITDGDGESIVQRNLQLDISKIKFFAGDQQIDPGFRRFDSLFEQDKVQWGRESGLKRQWMGIEAAIFGKDYQPLKLSQSVMTGNEAAFRSSEFNAGSKGWSLTHAARSVDREFSALSALPEGEMDGHIRSIAQMYGKDVPTRPEDRAAFIQSQGMSRSYTGLKAQPHKDWNLSIDSLMLSGFTDSAKVNSFGLAGKGVNLSYRQQTIGQGFDEINRLMEFEKQRIGPIAGLSRTDLGMSFEFGGGRILSLSQLNADHNGAGLKRQTFAYNDKSLQVNMATREVDNAFGVASQMVDPEKDLLASLQGFNERDIKAKWQMLSNMSFEAFLFDANNGTLGQDRQIRNYMLSYNPDSKTRIVFSKESQRASDPTQTLFENITQRLFLARDFGRLGILQYQRETQHFDGKDHTQADSVKEYLAYEAKIDDKTSLKTEQTRTRFDNGDKEDVSANTISTELSKRVGVSLTDVNVDRNGDDRDEKKRNYGFWFDFGKGMKLSYGYQRDMNGLNGTANKQFQLTPGQVGGIKVDSASYQENRWDNQNTQGLSVLALSSNKPFRFGFFKDINFSFGMDTATDRTAFIRDNKSAKIDTKIGSTLIGYEYKSQVDQTGYQGIDRGFKIVTDQGEKNWFKASLEFKQRELPDQSPIAIRNFNVTVKPSSRFELSHQLLTNPEEAFRGDVLLGSTVSPLRVNRWTLGYNASASTSVAATWEEKQNDLTLERMRLGGINLDLFKNSGSPLSLFYGVEQAWGAGPRRTAHRYYMRFDQRPGPNQQLSIFAGNVSYQHSIADGQHRNNWTLHLDYQLRF